MTVRQTEDGKHCDSEMFTLVFQVPRLIPGTARAGVAAISGIAALRAELARDRDPASREDLADEVERQVDGPDRADLVVRAGDALVALERRIKSRSEAEEKWAAALARKRSSHFGKSAQTSE